MKGVKLPFGATPSGVGRELIVVVAAALIFAFMRHQWPALNDYLNGPRQQ